MKTIRLELVDGKSAKFWEVTVTGTQQLVQFGRLGTKGTSKTKSFDSKAEATKASQRLIDQKMKKGYQIADDHRGESKSLARQTIENPKTGTQSEAGTKRPAASAKRSNQIASVSDSLKRIKAWVKHHHPSLWKTFNAPAKASEIGRAEKQLKLEFPSEVKEYFRFTNGVRPVGHMFVDLFPACGTPLKISEVAKRWKYLKDEGDLVEDDWKWMPKGQMKEVAFHQNWIPLSSDHVSIAIDMDPGPNGNVGQVITVATRWNFRHRFVIAESLAQYFHLLAANLESGRLTFYDEGGLDLEEQSMFSLDKKEYLSLDSEKGLRRFQIVLRRPKKKK